MENIMRIIHGFCGELWKNYAYIYSKNHNGIYAFDIITGKVDVFSARESFPNVTAHLSHGSILYNDVIYSFCRGLQVVF